MAKPAIYARPRYVRQRSYRRLRHGVNSLLKVFVDAEGSRLASSATERSFTANLNDTITSNGHGFVTGVGPILLDGAGNLPGGLAKNTFYWPIYITDNTFYVATSRKNAATGVRVDVTSSGIPPYTAEYASSGPAMLERLRQGVKPRTLRDEDDIDNL